MKLKDRVLSVSKSSTEPMKIDVTFIIHCEGTYDEDGNMYDSDWQLLDTDPGGFEWNKDSLPDGFKKYIESQIEEYLEDEEDDEDDEDGHSDENHDYPDPVRVCEK